MRKSTGKGDVSSPEQRGSKIQQQENENESLRKGVEGYSAASSAEKGQPAEGQTNSHEVYQQNSLFDTYQTIFNKSQSGIAIHRAILDENGRVTDFQYLDVNPIFETMTGFTREYLLSNTVRVVLPGMTQRSMDGLINAAMQGEETLMEQYTPRIGKWLEVAALPDRLGQFIGIMTDVTPRKKSQLEKECQDIISDEPADEKASGHMFLHLVDQLTATLDFPLGLVLIWDKSSAKIQVAASVGLNKQQKSTVSKPEDIHFWSDLKESGIQLVGFDNGDLPHNPLVDQLQMKSYIAVAIQIQDSTWGFLVLGDCVARSDMELCRSILIQVSQDLQKHFSREQIEGIVKETEERYRASFHGAGVALLIIDPETGQIIDANSAACQLYHYGLGDLLKLNINQINLADETDLRESLAQAMTKERTSFQFKHKTADGVVLDVEVFSSPIKIHGKQYLYSTILDVTEKKKIQSSLLENEQKFHTVVDLAVDGILLLDVNSAITFVNDRMVQMAGYDHENEILGKRPYDFIQSRDTELIQHHIQQTMDDGYSRINSMKLVKKDGSLITTDIQTVLMKDADGRPAFIVGYIRDLTEQIRSEEQTGKNEEYFRAIAGLTTDDAFSLEKDENGKISAEWRLGTIYQICGYTRNEMNNVNGWRVLFTHSEYDRLVGIINDQFSRPINRENHITIFDKKGDFHILHLTSASVLDEKTGLVKRVVGAVREITDQVRAEKSLAESERVFRTIFENGAVGMAMVTLDGVYQKANPMYCQMLGYDEKELIGNTIEMVTHPGSVNDTWKVIQDRIENKNPYQELVKQYVRKDGKIVWGLLRASTISDGQGKIQYIVAMVNDITELVRTTGELRLNEARLEALNYINQMIDQPDEEIARYVVNETVRLTASTIGYLAFLNEDETVITIKAWSDFTNTILPVSELPQQMVVVNTSWLSLAVKQRKPIVVNEVNPITSEKTKIKFGKLEFSRLANIPIFDGERVAAVVGIANKTEEYNDGDILQATLLVTGMWRIIQQKKYTEALRLSEAHNRRMVETSFEGILTLDVNHQIIYVNSRMAEILGCNPGELLGRRMEDLVADEDQTEYLTDTMHNLSGSSRKFEIRFLQKRNQPVWCLVSATPLWDEEGEFYGSFAMITDINERKLAEDKLRKNEELLRNAVTNITMVLFMLDRNGNLLLAEGKGTSALGLSSNELLGKNIFDIYYHHPPILKEIQRALTGDTFKSEIVLDNRIFDVWYSPVYNGRGDLDGTIGVAIEITHQREAEEQIRLSNEKYSKLFQTSPVLMSISEWETGRMIEANQVFLDTLGYTREEVIGRTSHELRLWVNPNERDRITSLIQLNGKADSLEIPVRRKNGEVLTLLFSANIIEFGGEQLFLAVTYDITAKKVVENQLHQSRQMLQLVLDTIPQRVFWKDAEGRYLGANRNYLMDIGAERMEDVIAKTDDDIFQADLAHKYSVDDGAVIQSNQPLINIDEQIKLKDDRALWVRTNKVPMHDQTGKIVGVLGTYEDVTAVREAREKLVESEERFRNLALFAPVGIYERNANFKVTFANQRLLDMTGVPAGYPVADCWKEGIDSNDHDRVMMNLQNTVMAGKDSYIEYRRNRPDGSLIWVADSEKIILDDKGNITGTMGTMADITQIKVAEEEIKQSLSLQTATLESTTDGLLVTDLSGKITSFNKRYLELWNLSEITMARMDRDLLDKQITPQLLNPDEFLGKHGHIRANRSDRSFNVVQLADGRIYEEFSMPQILDDDVVGRVWSYRDVTARFRADEKLRQNNTDMQEMIARLTALRNIDTAITGHSTFYDVVREILPNVILSLNVDAVAILLPHPDGDHLSIIGHQGLTIDQSVRDEISRRMIDIQGRFSGKAFRDRKMVWIHDLGAYPNGPQLGYPDNFQSFVAAPLIAKNEVKGVLEIYSRSKLPTDKNWRDFLHSLSLQVAIAIDNADLFNKMERTNLDLLAAYEATIEGWAKALELRDKETHGHSERVIDFTLRLASDMGIPESEMIQIRRGVFLHDIGKMAIPDNILLKPGPLTDDEWVIMKQHPSYAYEMLAGIPYLRPALAIPYCHHEKWDGSGYPQGLAGVGIPLSARIFAIVDVWDALTSRRPYRPAWPEAEVKAYLRDQSGRQFDPQIVDTFLAMIEKMEKDG